MDVTDAQVFYLRSRYQVACDRLVAMSGSRTRLQWSAQDAFAVRALLKDRETYVLRKYETLDRATAIRDGLL
jgi:hypothetical protein